MNTHRSVRLSLAGAVALALCITASIATAQTPPPPPTPPTPPPAPPAPPAATALPAQPATPMPAPQPSAGPQQGASGQFYPGTESSARYPLPDSNGGTLTVNTGMPADVRNYGPPPSFQSLDVNHDGRISESEAQAYPPLDNDFLHASGQGKSISRAQYEKWVQDQQ